MNIRNSIVTIGVICAALSVPVAHAKGPGGYIGLGFGQSSTDDLNGALLDAEFAALGIGTVTTVDDSDSAFRIFGGYQFNDNLAVEGAYTDFGEFSFNTLVVSGGSGRASGSWSGSDISVAALGILPVGQSVEFFGKAGLAIWDLDFNISVSGPGGSGVLSDSDSGVSPFIGIGARFHIAESFALRLDLERHLSIGDEETTGEGDVDIASIGVQISF